MKEIVAAVCVDVLVLLTTVVGLILVVELVATELVATEVPELDEQAPIKIAVTNAFIS